MLRSRSSACICNLSHFAFHQLCFTPKQNNTTQAPHTIVSYEVSRWNYPPTLLFHHAPALLHPPLATTKAKNGTTTSSQCLTESLLKCAQPNFEIRRVEMCIWSENKYIKRVRGIFPLLHLIFLNTLRRRKRRRRRSDSRWRIWAKAETLSADMNNGDQLHSSRHPKKTHWGEKAGKEEEDKKKTSKNELRVGAQCEHQQWRTQTIRNKKMQVVLVAWININSKAALILLGWLQKAV